MSGLCVFVYHEIWAGNSRIAEIFDKYTFIKIKI